jgi:hypothetical protein
LKQFGLGLLELRNFGPVTQKPMAKDKRVSIAVTQLAFLRISNDVFTVCGKVERSNCPLFRYGEVEEMNVCDNLGDHLVGNVYIKFRTEEDAAKAVADLNNRWFGGRPVYAELSPVTDFREACCREFFYLYFRNIVT